MTCFLSQGLWYGVGFGFKNVDMRLFPSVSHPLHPVSCKMRNRNSRRYQARKMYPNRPPNGKVPGNVDEDSDSSSNTTDLKDVATNDYIDVAVESEQPNEENYLTRLTDGASEFNVAVAEEQISAIDPHHLLGMIKNAEKNVLLLNKARVQALQDLEKILVEKEALQREMTNLEIKLAEKDSLLEVSAPDKVHADPGSETVPTELFNSQGVSVDVLKGKNIIRSSDVSDVHFLSEEIDSLRLENASLRSDLQLLKTQLNQIGATDNHVQMLEKERSVLESSLRGLQEELDSSRQEVSNLSALEFECKTMYQKVENLQELLDRATRRANQAIFVLQENQELRKKVDKLEDSLEEAKVYKLSSEKLQQYNDLMQQKIKILDQRLEKSDAEINGYVRSYEDSVKEFQDTLNHLKEEGKRRYVKEDQNDMPVGNWSGLLLRIEGWLLEKKVSMEDAKLMREMVWSRDGRICKAFLSCKAKNDDETICTLLQMISSSERPGLHVVHVAAEMAPVAKVGGLGDVVAGLGKALQKRGHLVEVVIPKYDCMQYELIDDLRELDVDVDSYFDGQLFRNRIWTGVVEGLPVYFIEPRHTAGFFWRGQYYGEHDDFKRFSFFSRAALELLYHAGKRPDIIHCHDWQTAFVAPLYWDIYVHKGLNSARICFTCHNFEYQGAAPASELGSCGLDVHHLNRPDRMQDNSAHDRVNPVKGAIVFSNIVTTVSPTYAQEVRTEEGGRGLSATLNSHAKKFVGILNGIDTDVWNPATDSFLKVQYSVHDIVGKAENKLALQRQLNLSSDDARRPLVGCITRLVPQKGVHLIRHAIFRTLELGGQFVLLGSSPVPHIQSEFEEISNQLLYHEHSRLILKYDEPLAHSIYAASDMFIIPSLFEPCGLTQMISMRYGSIPIARKTGGLNDSVFDIDDDTIPEQFRNGFTFLTADEPGINGALERAFLLYKSDGESWQKLVQKAMSIDFSWESSASMYEELYLKAVARARSANRV